MAPWSSSPRDSTPETTTAMADNHDPKERSETHERLSLWQKLTTVRINPVNNKCMTLPILMLNNPYSINFHLSWLGFWVAFLSWFAFSPLVPEAVRTDLKLTQKQIGDSNIVSLCATLIVRVIVGPLVDRFGPRKVMAGLLILGAIPSGLAGTIHSAQGLYVIRFFIGILGGTFVPCQAWTTAFYDTGVVGRANALVGGWGNSGGGFTFIIMVALYNKLRSDGLSPHSAWRAAFAIVPVPILFFVALLILFVGTDHPNGKWANRHKDRPMLPPALIAATHTGEDYPALDVEKLDGEEKEKAVDIGVHAVAVPGVDAAAPSIIVPDSIPLSWGIARDVLVNPLTWLPALAYLTSFGYELAIDANLSNVFFGLYNPTKHGFDQTTSGYIASIYGLLNLVTRPFGGYLGDLVYRRYGVPGKKYLVLITGLLQGVFSIALGVYIDHHHHAQITPPLAVVIVIMVILATFDEVANGANFSLVPHCNPGSNGFMTGIVGAMGNLGGVWFALIFRYQPAPFGKAFWIGGIVIMIVNVLLVFIRVPRK